MGNYGNDVCIEHFERSKRKYVELQKKLSEPFKSNNKNFELNKLISAKAKRVISMGKKSVLSYDAKVNSRSLEEFL